MAFSYAALRSWMFNISPAPAALAKRASKTFSSARVMFSRLRPPRSEEHTSELQSHLNLVCRLLLEKKKNICPTTDATWCSSGGCLLLSVHNESQMSYMC